MRYEGAIYRPPSEADAYILQGTIGCSWNACTYCDMYRAKKFRVRDLGETLEDIRAAASEANEHVRKVFVGDGDALAMDTDHWLLILAACRTSFPKLKRVSAYATAMNLKQKSVVELRELRDAGLTQLYIGPETGDDVTFKRIAKGANFADHVEAAERARAANIKLSTIFLLGAGGIERSAEHAKKSGELITAMDPAFASALTLTVVPGTPISKLEQRGKFVLPVKAELLRELRTMVAVAAPTKTVFRTNHASNYLPLSGELPSDKDRIVSIIDQALSGAVPLRPEWSRGL